MYDSKKMKLVIILCAFIGHVYSAPSPCIDLCGQTGDINTKTSESLQTYRTHSSLSDENVLRDHHQSMLNQLQNAHQTDLQSTRPGNWTEHNDYVTDNGSGSVHEERGQLVKGASKVNYYKKNYASSYGSGVSDANNAGASLLSNNHLNTHNTIDRTIVRNHEQPNYYNKQNSHLINHSTGSSSSDNLARLENFGEQTDTQIHDNFNTAVVGDNAGDNWTRHNTYATDGGRGKVYEEEGQYNRGSAQVRYYKKNYTSSFSTSGGGDVATIPITAISDANAEIDAQMNRIKSQLEQVNSQINQQTRHLSTNIDNSNLHRDGEGSINGHYDYHTRNHIATIQNVPVTNRVAVTPEQHHEKYSSSQSDHGINIHGNHQQIAPLPSQNQYIAPISHIQSVNSQHQVEQQVYVPTSNINSQINSLSSQHQQRHSGDTTIRIPIYRSNSGININGGSNSYLQNQELNTNENRHDESIYNQHTEHVAVQPQLQRHVEQHWSTSEHRSHSTIPQHIMVGDAQEISNSQHLESLGQHQYGTLTRGGYDNVNHGTTNNYIADISSSYPQNYGSHIHRGNAQTIQHGYHGADCDDATQVEYNSQHGRIRYKRGADYSQHNEDLSQQTFGKLELEQQTQHVYNQHDDESDSLQQTQGYGNRHQAHQHNRFDDYTQQHSGNLELDSQQSTHGFDDYTQQHTGNLEIDQQHTQQYQDSSQRSQHEFGDFTQQQSGNLELDQQHQSHIGQLEFGQQTEDHNRHHGRLDQYRHHGSRGHADQDLTQQSTHGFEDYTQQHMGNLEVGQQHQDSSQRSQHELGDFTQQQSGNLELDQQHQSHSGQLEFGQQTEDRNRNHERLDQYRHHGSRGHADRDSTQQSTHGFEDYTQQHMGNLEVGQQHQDSSQRSQHELGDFTQQQSGNLELDQQHQSHSGQLEFGQQTEHDGHFYHVRDNQFGNHDTQQQSGSLELGQRQTHGNYDRDHVQQRDQSIIEQSSGNNDFGLQQSDDLTQQTGNIGDFSQQSSGNLEFGQQTRNNENFSQTNEHNYESSRPAPKPTPRSQRIGHYERGNTNPSPVGVKGGHRRGPGHQGEFNSRYSQPIDEPSEGVVSLEQQVVKDESINVFQPRILEAYGGNGPYDANHNENIYTDVKANPSATLAPIVDGKEPWDIREVSENDYFAQSGSAKSIITETSTNLYPENISTTVAPGFWKRVGQKITNTYEKAKDKVSDVFG